MEPDHYRFWPANLPREMPLPQTSLYRNLEDTVERFADKTAVFYYGTPLSYLQFKRDVDAMAGFLQQRAGVKRGDRVLLFMQNSPQFMVAFYAIAIVAASWHFAYGLWLFAAKWGITVGERARKRFGYLCFALALGLVAIGAVSMYGFLKAPLQPLDSSSSSENIVMR